MRVTSLLVGLLLACACSPARMGMNRMADALTDTASAYAKDGDPEFVRLGAPSTLKMIEMLLDTQPAHRGLLETACSGFTQYAYAFLQVDSELLAAAEPAASRDLAARAGQMYGRAREYCLRAIGTSAPALAGMLQRDHARAAPLLDAAGQGDVAVLYWTAAAWAGELAVAPNQLLRLPELGTVRALLARALALDERWGEGAIHEAMIAVEGLPALLGGSSQRARQHFDRAVALSDGRSAFAYVTMASSVSAPARDRAEFERLLKQALAIDNAQTPELRLANLIAQRRARHLLATAGTLFE
jgi:predicted anti-sigma-YlaC factor YlaD